MFSLILILSISGLTILDLFLLIQLSRGPGIAIITITQLITAIVGFLKIRSLDLNLLFFLDAELKKNESVVRELWDEAFVLIAAFLLVIPGFLTDFIASLCFIPSIRKLCLDFIEGA